MQGGITHGRLVWRRLDNYSMAPWEGGERLPFTVCKVGNKFEAWDLRGGTPKMIQGNLGSYVDAQNLIIEARRPA